MVGVARDRQRTLQRFAPEPLCEFTDRREHPHAQQSGQLVQGDEVQGAGRAGRQGGTDADLEIGEAGAQVVTKE